MLTADVATEAGVDAASFPAEFDVEVQLYEDGKYRIVKFMDTEIYNTNQGNTVVEVAENGNSATISLSQAWGMFIVAGGYPNYMTMTDKDGAATSLNVVLGAGNVLKMDDFSCFRENRGCFPYRTLLSDISADNSLLRSRIRGSSICRAHPDRRKDRIPPEKPARSPGYKAPPTR